MSVEEDLPQDLLFQVLHREEDESFLIANMVNVAACSVLVGAMGLPRENLVELGLAGLLHDIGKLHVPEEILFKTAPLSQEERGEAG